MDRKLISIVVPCYNEELTVEKFYNETVRVFEGYKHDIEIIFVDDGSKDATYQIICNLANKDARVKGLSFSRNFGHQSAIICGFEHAKGDAIVELDCDLQDPLETVLEMVDKWEEGYQVIHGRRVKRKGESLFKKASASIYYALLNKITKRPVPRNTGDFKLYDRVALNTLLNLPERDKYIRGLASWIGFKQTFVDFERKERFAGETKYTLKKMLRLAWDGITSFSVRPLRMLCVMGALAVLVSVIMAIYTLVSHFIGSTVSGWSSLMISIWFLGGLNLLALGIVGEYIGKIYGEVKDRPRFIVEQTKGLN